MSTFDAQPGQRVYFERPKSSANNPYWQWTLEDERGEVVFASLFNADAGARELVRGGRYTLRVTNQGVDATGKYAFKLWDIPPDQEFEIAVGDTVSDGAPADGAGYIDNPGQQDIYTFTAEPRQKVFVDLATTPTPYMVWQLMDETGLVVFGSLMNRDLGVVELRRGGHYTLIVNLKRGGLAMVGPYSFSLARP